MPHLCLARAAVCALATLALSAIAASPSSAAVASSTITTPSDPSYLQEDGQTPAPITVSGTAIDDGGGGAVDLRCYTGESSELFASEVPVSYSGQEGAFSTSFIPNGINLEQTCVLRAVPAGEEPSSLSSFAGPRVALSYFEDSEVTEGPNAGDIQDFFISDSQLDGVGDYRSLTGGGMYDASPLDSSFVSGGDLFYANDTYNALSGAGVSGSSIQVNGIDAYGPASASGLFTGSSSLPGFQPLTVMHSYDPASGDLTVHETEPLLECAPEPAVYPPTESSCASFVGAGVSVTRAIHQDQQGRQSTLTDTYSSTDGRDHRLHLESIEDASDADAGYDFPWVDGETYKPRTAGETVSPPTQGPLTVFVNYKNSEADGDPQGAQGAITFSGLPDDFAFAPSGLAGETHFTATFTRTISPTAPVTLTQVFSWSSTSSQARTLAATAQSAQSPTVTITSPAGEATLTTSPAHITGIVTAGGNGLPETVTVQGEQVKLAPDGSFSAEVPLLTGANTITATATDTEKLSSSATVSVSYTPVEPISGQGSPPSSASSPKGRPAARRVPRPTRDCCQSRVPPWRRLRV